MKTFICTLSPLYCSVHYTNVSASRFACVIGSFCCTKVKSCALSSSWSPAPQQDNILNSYILSVVSTPSLPDTTSQAPKLHCMHWTACIGLNSLTSPKVHQMRSHYDVNDIIFVQICRYTTCATSSRSCGARTAFKGVKAGSHRLIAAAP
jgi:hypothetical protein